jgi:hypothetical protein
MIGQAATTVSVLRGTEISEDGDVIDGGNAVATGVPALIRELAADNRTEATDSPRTIRQYMVSVPNSTDVRPGDRIRDERTGDVYAVDFAQTPPMPLLADKEIKVRRTD